MNRSTLESVQKYFCSDNQHRGKQIKAVKMIIAIRVVSDADSMDSNNNGQIELQIGSPAMLTTASKS